MRIVRLEEVPEEGVSHDPELRKRVLLRRGEVPHLTALSRARLRAMARFTRRVPSGAPKLAI